MKMKLLIGILVALLLSATVTAIVGVTTNVIYLWLKG